MFNISHTSKISDFLISKPLTFSKAKIPAFLTALYISFLLVLIRMVAIPLPFTFVPIVFVVQAVFVLSWKLGSKKALLAVLFFLFQGSLIHLIQIGPLSGYQVGYLIAAFFIGSASQNLEKPTLLKIFLIFNFATLLMYFSGLAVLIPLLGIKKAFLTGMLPFLLPDLVKNILAVKVLEKMQKISL